MEYLLEFVIDLIFELIIGIFDNGAQILRKLGKAYKKESMRRNSKEVLESEADTDGAE